MTLHIYAPKASATWKRILDCSTCKKRTLMVCSFTHWHGMDWQCTECGDSWQDGWRADRPFERGWRKKAIAHAREVAASITEPVQKYRAKLPKSVIQAIERDLKTT